MKRGRKVRDKIFSTQQSFNRAIKSVCDVLRRSSCAGALQYIPELTWIIFLRFLDELEASEQEEAGRKNQSYTPSLSFPYRWQDWASPQGGKRLELQNAPANAMLRFVNETLIPQLKSRKQPPSATPRQQLISSIMSGIDRTHIDSGQSLLEVIDQVDKLTTGKIDKTHIFALSQIYEGLLLKMGEKANDGGQFFTPREIIRAMIQVIAPQPGETIYDPCCGTGGFLIQSHEYMQKSATAAIPKQIQGNSYYGCEKEKLIYPVALANLVLHGIDQPHIEHTNTLAHARVSRSLFQERRAQFDVILTNPPFGGKESKEVQKRFDFKTSSTQILFLQHIIESLKVGGRCGIVLDEGVLFRTNDTAFAQTKRKLLRECDVWCIVSLPPGVFAGAGTGAKTNLVFFRKGEATKGIWYYDLATLKVAKKKPLAVAAFEEFFNFLPARPISTRSWTLSIDEIVAKNYDLKAVNPHSPDGEDPRSLEELLNLIETKGRETASALLALREVERGIKTRRVLTVRAK